MFALSFSPQTINAGQDTLHNESLKSNSVIVPHKLITSAFLRPNCLNIVFGIKRTAYSGTSIAFQAFYIVLQLAPVPLLYSDGLSHNSVPEQHPRKARTKRFRHFPCCTLLRMQYTAPYKWPLFLPASLPNSSRRCCPRPSFLLLLCPNCLVFVLIHVSINTSSAFYHHRFSFFLHTSCCFSSASK